MSARNKKVDLDFCEYCNAALTIGENLVTVYRHRKGQHFIFERVPAQVCPRCGERYFSAQVVRDMDRLMQKPKRSATVLPVPVMTFKPLAR
jgi:YgiT-type zinc finger domain-containing protein